MDVHALCRRLDEGGEHAWVVGGCLRDILLGKRASDWDVATTAEPRKVQRLFRRVIPTGIDHGTVTVLLNGVGYEVTTLRGEGAYTDGRRPDEVFFVRDIREDLARRDFTVNAIAYDPLTKDLVDPFDGLGDLERKVLRAVGSPIERFTEDGLRILRGARFTATLEGFTLDPATEAAFRQTLPTFEKVSHERVRDEWMKAMRARRPSRAFEVMERTGILAVTSPELAELAARAPDRWARTLRAVDASKGAIVRHAALFHRVAEHRSFDGVIADDTARGNESAAIADRFLREYRYSNDERETVAHLVRCSTMTYDASWTDADVRRFLRRVEPRHLSDVLELAFAIGEQAPERLAELEARCEAVREGLVLGPKELAITGNDLMQTLGSGPGPHLGEILRILVERVTDDPALNRADALLALGAELEPEARAATARSGTKKR
jgi:tRNA nucleotidyltransferase (CCA-adding enzyme)